MFSYLFLYYSVVILLLQRFLVKLHHSPYLLPPTTFFSCFCQFCIYYSGIIVLELATIMPFSLELLCFLFVCCMWVLSLLGLKNFLEYILFAENRIYRNVVPTNEIKFYSLTKYWNFLFIFFFGFFYWTLDFFILIFYWIKYKFILLFYWILLSVKKYWKNGMLNLFNFIYKNIKVKLHVFIFGNMFLIPNII